TARPTMKAMMSSLTMTRFRLLILARQLQVWRFFLAALALRFQWSWPGHTWQSLPILVHFVLDRSGVIMASMSASKGLARAVTAVETSDGRATPSSFSSNAGNGSE